MFIIDKPYVSGLLRNTITKNGYPVLKTKDAIELLEGSTVHFIDEESAVEKIRSGEIQTIYTSSENSIGWIAQHLGFSELPNQVDVFKNKTRFRKLVSKLYPDFYFKKVKPDEIENILYDDQPKPFIIKPNVGFFSLGVHKVTSKPGWEMVKQKILQEADLIKHTYPEEVLNIAEFIIEENIEGEEFTIDAFYNHDGKPFVLGMMHHIFAGEEDTSDRLYTTSPQIIRENLGRFREFLEKLGHLVNLKNFPLHIEVRVDALGNIMPIEGNPLRYGGWCTSAELTHYAFGFNPYEYVMEGKQPDWDSILGSHSGNRFSIIILNNNSGLAASGVKLFDYEKLTGKLEKVLELRKVDAAIFHIFGFVYAETRPDNFGELAYLLNSDLKEFFNV
jgi:hypothetical protein